MASAMKHIKQKAMAERSAAEKMKMAGQLKVWHQRSANTLGPPAAHGEATATRNGPAVELSAAPEIATVEVVDRRRKTRNGFWKWQPQVRRFYEGSPAQMTVAALIMLKFLCNIVEKVCHSHTTHILAY